MLFLSMAGFGIVAVASSPKPIITEIPFPDGLSSAHTIALDNEGHIWFTEKLGKKLARFDPDSKEFEAFTLPHSWGDVGFSTFTIGSAGDIWFTVRRGAGNIETQNVLGKYTPSDGFFTKYMLSLDALPEELLVDHSGAIWFVASNENHLYRVDPEKFSVKGYPVPTPNALPRNIVLDEKGAIWFTEPNVNKIAKFDPEKELFYEYTIPTPFSNPGKITIDAAGRVWFVQLNGNRIGAFYPDLKRFDEALIPTRRSTPIAISADNNGNIWFLEYRGNKVGVFIPGEAIFHEFDIPLFGSLPGDMVIDHKRSILWFTEGNTEAKRLGMLSITEALAQSNQDAVPQELHFNEDAKNGTSLPADSNWLLYLMLVMVMVLVLIAAAWLKRSKTNKIERAGDNG